MADSERAPSSTHFWANILRIDGMDERESILSIALTRLSYFNLAGLLSLYQHFGSATEIMNNRAKMPQLLPDMAPRLARSVQDMAQYVAWAEAEWRWCQDNGVRVLCYADPDYPQRLRECPDAPVVIFHKGTANLNPKRAISVVGTRRCTPYGVDIVRRFMADLRQLCPQVLVVSGLAYGIDIHAHRDALAQGYDTVGVLAHGLDTLYPSAHRQTAQEMTAHGGLVSEFPMGTNADKRNFVRRNRIIAGLSDATLLVESSTHGGGLITCRIARDYNRDVFAFPGSVTAESSQGCNNLIRDNGAALVSSAADFVNAMGWEDDQKLQGARQKGIERELFPDLSADEKAVTEALTKANDLPISVLSVHANIPVARLSATLFTLEMKGIVRPLAGGLYHINR